MCLNYAENRPALLDTRISRALFPVVGREHSDCLGPMGVVGSSPASPAPFLPTDWDALLRNSV